MSQPRSSGQKNTKQHQNSGQAKIWSAAFLAVVVIAFAVRLFGGPDLFAWLAGETSSEIASSAVASERENNSGIPKASSQSAAVSGQNMKVHFLDVGQADCVVVQLPNDQTMVIDAGNNGDGKLVVQYLQDLGISSIDYLVGTHPHEDHIGGMDNLIRAFRIKAFYMPKVSEKLTPTTATYNDVLTAAEDKKLKIKSAKAGVTLFEDASIGLKAEILSPDASLEYSDLNNYSAVIRLTYGSRSFLFTGDAEVEAEKIMLDGVIRTTKCFLCNREIKQRIKWFSNNQHVYYCVAYCENHGLFKGKIRFKKTEDDLYYAIKILKQTDENGVAEIIQKQDHKRERRRAKRSREKQRQRQGAQK